MNLAGVIGSLASGTYTVTRTGAGAYGGLPGGFPMTFPAYDGRYREGTPSTLSIRAVIQPVRGRDLLRLPEGQRTEEMIAIYTETELQTASAPGGGTADVVSYRGKSYQVQTVEAWNELGNFYKAIAAKVGQ